ncbi:MAG: HAMP domain-containing histidine kinase [Elusimicrobia bacterium]|nr:HAMP domain-containing histidine kinase [Elusimicrobiota bacterium]
MTRKSLDRLADLAMILVERIGYLMAFAPFVIGRWGGDARPSTAPALLLDAGLGCAILAVALLMGYSRRQAHRVNSLRRTLNEAIIHDLKNPMTTIMGCLSCVVEDALDAPQRDKLINLALHSCRSQMILLETLVDTSRLEHGELVAETRAIRTRTLLDSCLNDVAGIAEHVGVSLRAGHTGVMPPMLQGDPDLLPRALCNLLHNAVKYTPPGGSVSLNARFGPTGFVFEINDTGIGIRPEHIDRLFRKYYRVEGADQTSRRGSGLGLYFCRLVIEAHGGKVGIESKAGSGTTITFNIPQISNGANSHERSRHAGSTINAAA